MHARSRIRLFACAALTTLVASSSCSKPKPYDWKNRDISWAYGPTQGAARSEHLEGTGTKGPGKITEGWKCHLVDGNKLTIKPYNLAKSHALFGKTKLIVGLFDKSGAQLQTLTTGTLTKENASFEFDVEEKVAKPLWDLVIWYGKP